MTAWKANTGPGDATSQKAGRSCGTGPGPLRQSRRLWLIDRPVRVAPATSRARRTVIDQGREVPAWPELPGRLSAFRPDDRGSGQASPLWTPGGAGPTTATAHGSARHQVAERPPDA